MQFTPQSDDLQTAQGRSLGEGHGALCKSRRFTLFINDQANNTSHGGQGAGEMAKALEDRDKSLQDQQIGMAIERKLCYLNTWVQKKKKEMHKCRRCEKDLSLIGCNFRL